MNLHYAEMQTEHYTFRALGDDANAARHNVLSAFHNHLANRTHTGTWQNQIDSGFIPEGTTPESWYGINTWDFMDSAAYCDDSPIEI